MKWFFFALAVACVFPAAAWLRQNPRRLPMVITAIGALPFVWGIFPKREIAIFGAPGWPGYVQGFDVSALDLLILVVFLSHPRRRHAPLPFKFSFAIYIFAVLLSALQASVPVATFYYVWQLLRIFFMYAVLARACSERNAAEALLKGLAIGVCFVATVVFWQRFVIHYVQAPGTFTTQNMLGVALHFATFPFFSVVLSGKLDWLPTLVPVLGAMTDVFTASRASVGFAGIGYCFLFILSIVRRWTPRKTRVLLAAVLLLAVLSPLAYRQFSLRMSVYGIEGYYGRSALIDSAAMILSENAFGIGANNYVVAANVRDYYARAGVGQMERNTFPHNIYWTTAAETGYFGFASFVVFLLRPLVMAFIRGWRYRKDQRGDLLLGLGTSLLIVYAHSYFEWIFLTDQLQYLFAIDLALIAGLTHQLASRSKNVNTNLPSAEFFRKGSFQKR